MDLRNDICIYTYTFTPVPLHVQTSHNCSSNDRLYVIHKPIRLRIKSFHNKGSKYISKLFIHNFRPKHGRWHSSLHMLCTIGKSRVLDDHTIQVTSQFEFYVTLNYPLYRLDPFRRLYCVRNSTRTSCSSITPTPSFDQTSVTFHPEPLPSVKTKSISSSVDSRFERTVIQI